MVNNKIIKELASKLSRIITNIIILGKYFLIPKFTFATAVVILGLLRQLTI